jgi:SAM-dependent methyltransferase
MRFLIILFILKISVSLWAMTSCWQALESAFKQSGKILIPLSDQHRKHLVDTIFYPSQRRHIEISPYAFDEMLYYFSGTSPIEIPVFSRDLSQYSRFLSKVGFAPDKWKNEVVVDLGSGMSKAADELSSAERNVRGVGLDTIFHPEFRWLRDPPNFYINQARELGLHMENRIGASLTSLPFKDNEIDRYIAVMSLYYLREEASQQALAEILRTLKPGGRGYIVNDDTWSPSPMGSTEAILDALRAWKIPYYFPENLLRAFPQFSPSV